MSQWFDLAAGTLILDFCFFLLFFETSVKGGRLLEWRSLWKWHLVLFYIRVSDTYV